MFKSTTESEITNAILRNFAEDMKQFANTEVIIGGYTMSRGTPADTMFLCILDPFDNFSIKWNYTWSTHDPIAIGTFGITWDQENEILWTCQAGGEKIYKHIRVSEKTYLIGFFEK